MKDKENQECLKVGGEGRSDPGKALGSSSAEPSTAPWDGVGLGEMLKLRECPSTFTTGSLPALLPQTRWFPPIRELQ